MITSVMHSYETEYHEISLLLQYINKWFFIVFILPLTIFDQQ